MDFSITTFRAWRRWKPSLNVGGVPWDLPRKCCTLLALAFSQFLGQACNALHEVFADCRDEKRVEFVYLIEIRRNIVSIIAPGLKQLHSDILATASSMPIEHFVMFKNSNGSWIGCDSNCFTVFVLPKRWKSYLHFSIAHRGGMSWTTVMQK